MAGAGPLTSQQVAASTALVERYVREWLAVQVASGYVDYAPVEPWTNSVTRDNGPIRGGPGR
jgi:hypothetical protein